MVIIQQQQQQQEEEIIRSDQRGKKGMRIGKYEFGRTLGQGNFGKVKYAKHIDSGKSFAIKILEKHRIHDLRITDQIKREIRTLKVLKHPNVVRLYEVLASKTKIYMVLEYVNGGELFDRILENVLIDGGRNIKITDFGLSALPQHLREVTGSSLGNSLWQKCKDDGLLHTTCGSPNYVAPEVLSNRGYDGATSDTWSCGVILYVILTGFLPFDDRNLAVLYHKIFKGDAPIPKWLSQGAKNLIRRILDPNPQTRITMAEIKEDEWFKQDYTPAIPDEEEDLESDDASSDDEVLTVHDAPIDTERDSESPSLINNAFQLIGMSSCLDLSGFFENEDASERKIRFTSNLSPKELLERIENLAVQMGFQVQKKTGKVFEISTSLYVVELQKSSGDSTVYRQVYTSIPRLDRGRSRTSSVNSTKLLARDPGFASSPRTSDTDQLFFITQLCNRLSDELGVQQSEELQPT
ncbi:CBL-interacting protein kinase 1 [Capsicum annuum]|nr:CBL-interacting protein kinase 1 [Capsicum annuum]